MNNTVVIGTVSPLSLPLIQYLFSVKKLQKVCVPKEFLSISDIVRTIIPSELVEVIDQKQSMSITAETSMVILFGYSFKVDIDRKVTMVNIHFGDLPSNRGADPVFWSLKNEDQLAHIVIHKLSTKFDSGDIVLKKGFDILPSENWGFLNARLSQLVIPMVEELLKGDLSPKPQDESSAVYFNRPTEQDLTIDWVNMSAFQIERLVNACNPKYGGAVTSIHQGMIRLVEVKPAQVNMAENEPEPQSGTVVHSSPENGLYVACKDNKFLQLMIISTNEGIFSGNKMAGFSNLLGLVLGE